MIILKDVVLHRGSKTLLDGASLTLNPGEKVGLVGRNGTGKSTLFALLDGSLREDGGICQVPTHWRRAQVSQHMPETPISATAFVLEGDAVLMAARAEVHAAEASGDGERMGYAYTALYDAGEADAVSRAQTLILGLGFQQSELNRPVNSFSGGWRMRLQLARALICPSDLLLLDEPTNHLDLDALVWLETWLTRYSGTLLLISHDRDFLDNVCQVTVHLERQRLTRYGGNYAFYEKQRAERLALEQSAYTRQQDQIAHLQKFIARFKAKASKAKQAQSRVKALGRMEMLAPLLLEAEFTFTFSPPKHLPNPMLTLENGVLGYAAAPILSSVNLSVLAGQRIGILGANGQGKSTLVKTIARAISPLHGELTEGRGLRIGYFAQQEMDVLDSKANPLEHFVRLAKDLAQQGILEGQGTREQDLKNFLGQFHFGGDRLFQAVGTMSGGEKARLVLSMIVWQRPNLLLLDEPTNHLDLTTREALSMALNEFDGTVMLVSHDRALLREVCDEFWMVSQGRVSPFPGDLEDYQRFLLEEARRSRVPTETIPTTPIVPVEPQPLDTKRRESIPKTKPPVREVARLEQQMADLHEKKKAAELALSTTQDPATLRHHGELLTTLICELEKLEEQWLTLTS